MTVLNTDEWGGILMQFSLTSHHESFPLPVDACT